MRAGSAGGRPSAGAGRDEGAPPSSRVLRHFRHVQVSLPASQAASALFGTLVHSAFGPAASLPAAAELVPAMSALWDALSTDVRVPTGWLRTADLTNIALGFELAGEACLVDDRTAAMLWWHESRAAFGLREGATLRDVVRERMEEVLLERWELTPLELRQAHAAAHPAARSHVVASQPVSPEQPGTGPAGAANSAGSSPAASPGVSPGAAEDASRSREPPIFVDFLIERPRKANNSRPPGPASASQEGSSVGRGPPLAAASGPMLASYSPLVKELAAMKRLEETLKENSRSKELKQAYDEPPLKLNLVPAMLDHVAAIIRALRLPSRGLLLYGPHHSGKRSLVRLASLVAGVSCMNACGDAGGSVRLSSSEWRAKLRSALKHAGVEGKPVALLAAVDRLPVDGSALTDLQGVFAGGSEQLSSSLFSADELTAIEKSVVTAAKRAREGSSSEAVLSFFWLRALRNTHPMLCFTDHGDGASGVGDPKPTEAEITEAKADDWRARKAMRKAKRAKQPDRAGADDDADEGARAAPKAEGAALTGGPGRSELAEFMVHCPALSNCCSTHWVPRWAESSKHAMAMRLLGAPNSGINPGGYAGGVRGIATALVAVHESALALLAERGHVVAPTDLSFVQLLNEYKDILAAQRTSLTNRSRSLSAGLDRLLQASSAASELEHEKGQLEAQHSANEIELQVQRAGVAADDSGEKSGIEASADAEAGGAPKPSRSERQAAIDDLEHAQNEAMIRYFTHHCLPRGGTGVRRAE